MSQASKVTADNIRQALEETYIAPEWYIGFEVGNSTGAHCRRHADAVAINAYPSKGFETRGFEIKVSKQDLKKELENGIKSDEIARFCDYWFLVVPKGLADGFVLPPTWGVIEYIDGKLRHKTGVGQLDKTQPTFGFLCAMLRGRERVVFKKATKVSKDREEQIRRDATWGLKNAEIELKQLRENLEKIKESTGISLDRWDPTREIIDRLNAVNSLEIITKNIRFIDRRAKAMLQEAQEIQSAVYEMRSKEDPHGKDI